jgi:Family of unknown function (DUF6364)
MQRNVTVKLDEQTIHKAKIVAAKRSTSVSRLIADEIDRLVREDDAYEQARVEALADLESGWDLGSEGRLPRRADVYDR